MKDFWSRHIEISKLKTEVEELCSNSLFDEAQPTLDQWGHESHALLAEAEAFYDQCGGVAPSTEYLIEAQALCPKFGE